MKVNDYFREEREKGRTCYLSEEYAEGKVEKLLYGNWFLTALSGEVSELALLRLEPGSKIKYHQHIDDSEVYFILESGVILECKSGEWHGLMNNTSSDMYVFSVKNKK